MRYRTQTLGYRRSVVLPLASTWPQLWLDVQPVLRQAGYSRSTLLYYRQVLRQFAAWFRAGPRGVTSGRIRDCLIDLAHRGVSWSWMAGHITVMRTVFDKLGGMDWTRSMHTPKRPLALPEVLNRGEVRSVLAAADTLRDQLLIGLLYGCGLKPGELAALRWKHILLSEKQLWIAGSLNTGSRHLPIPSDLMPLLTEGVSACLPDDYIFAGARHGRPLTRAMVERIVHRCAVLAGVAKPVTAMSFRHAYAVHNLEAGMSVRELQRNLGQYRLRTTMRYQRCLVPRGVTSPIDALRQHGSDFRAGSDPRMSYDSTPDTQTAGRGESIPACRPDADGALFVSAPTTLPLAFPFKPEGASGRGIREFAVLFRQILAGRFLAARRYFSSG